MVEKLNLTEDDSHLLRHSVPVAVLGGGCWRQSAGLIVGAQARGYPDLPSCISGEGVQEPLASILLSPVFGRVRSLSCHGDVEELMGWNSSQGWR